MSKRKPLKSAAVLTLHGAPEYTPSGAKRIAAWLENQAELLRDTKMRKQLDTKRYQARYLYEEAD